MDIRWFALPVSHSKLNLCASLARLSAASAPTVARCDIGSAIRPNCGKKANRRSLRVRCLKAVPSFRSNVPAVDRCRSQRVASRSPCQWVCLHPKAFTFGLERTMDLMVRLEGRNMGAGSQFCPKGFLVCIDKVPDPRSQWTLTPTMLRIAAHQ